jgi:hypothetical protein
MLNLVVSKTSIKCKVVITDSVKEHEMVIDMNVKETLKNVVLCNNE